MIRLSEMCSKLETEYEKVLPFYTSSLSEEELNQERVNAMEPLTEKLAQVMSTELKLIQITLSSPSESMLNLHSDLPPFWHTVAFHNPMNFRWGKKTSFSQWISSFT